jgi:hypothetical protein
MNDPFEQFLITDFSGSAPPELRQGTLAQTLHVLRRRRRLRRLAQAGALAACFLAGMGTMLFWSSVTETERAVENRGEGPHVASMQEKPAAPLTKPKTALSLVELEWQAFDSRDNRAVLFFAVADRYFAEERDYDAALRCYRQALDASPREALSVRPNDNWLVMALKEARLKETDDATVNH